MEIEGSLKEVIKSINARNEGNESFDSFNYSFDKKLFGMSYIPNKTNVGADPVLKNFSQKLEQIKIQREEKVRLETEKEQKRLEEEEARRVEEQRIEEAKREQKEKEEKEKKEKEKIEEERKRNEELAEKQMELAEKQRKENEAIAAKQAKELAVIEAARGPAIQNSPFTIFAHQCIQMFEEAKAIDVDTLVGQPVQKKTRQHINKFSNQINGTRVKGVSFAKAIFKAMKASVAKHAHIQREIGLALCYVIADALVDIVMQVQSDEHFELAVVVGRICALIMTHFHDFEGILIGCICKKCPLLFLQEYPEDKLTDDADFLMWCGFTTQSNGMLEKAEDFKLRNNGCTALIAVLANQQWENNPQWLSRGWEFLSHLTHLPHQVVKRIDFRICNVTKSKQCEILVGIIDTYVRAGGYMMHSAFGNEFMKMMIAIRDGVLPHYEKDPLTTKLNSTLEVFFSGNRFRTPKTGIVLKAQQEKNDYIY